MTDNENKIAFIKGKIKKFENSRTLMAALFALLCYYFYDSFKEGTASIYYFIVIGIFMIIDICVFIYVSILIHKFTKERKELEQ